MGYACVMAAKLNIKLPLPDKTKLKTMGAKFNAWWNGTEYVAIEENSEEVGQEAEVSLANNGEASEVQDSQTPVSEPEANSAHDSGLKLVPPIERISFDSQSAIQSAAILWGEGRITPSNNDFDLSLVKDLGLNKGNRFGIFCGEAGAQAACIIKSANCKTEAYFVEAKVKDAAIAYIKAQGLEKSFATKMYDGSPKSVPKNRFEQVLMVYQSSTKEETESNIFALARMLKPKGVAAWVNFLTREGEARLEESSGNERRQFLTNSDILPAFEASGLVIVSDEECSADLLNAYYKRQAQIVENWDNIQGQLMQKGGVEAVRAALEQTMVWRARIEALKSGRLHLRKFILRHG